jgi:hypothetical protein
VLRAYGQAVHRYRTDQTYTLAVAAVSSLRRKPAANEQAYAVERAVIQPDLDLPLGSVQSALDLLVPDEPRAAEARPEQFVDLRLVQGLQRAGYFDRLAAP